MAILNMFTVQLGQQNSRERLVRVHSNDTLAQVTSLNYLASYMKTHAMNLYAADTVLVAYAGGQGFFQPVLSNGNITLQTFTTFIGGLPSGAATSGITALAGGGQTGATLLTNYENQIATSATSGDSVLLPVTSTGHPSLLLANAGAAPSNVYPQVGDKINGLTVNTPFSLVNGKNALFFSPVAGQWYVILSA